MQSLRISFKNMRIERKISAAILITCVTALAVAAAAIFVTQLIDFRHRFERDLDATAQMIGQTITASVTFNDDKGASNVLSAVQAKPHILAATLDLPDGSEFAAYRREGLAKTLEIPKSDGSFFVGPFLALNQPVSLKGERIATLHLLCDYKQEYTRSLLLFAGILAGVLLVSVLLALLLSHRLQRLISSPVLNLAETARNVAGKNDYSLRAQVWSHDEVGELTIAFNQMLARIQEQDQALTRSQAKMEALVNSVDGIVWECVPETFQFLFLSRQCQRILGYEHTQWLSDADVWKKHLHPDDVSRAVEARKDAMARKQPYNCEYRVLAADNKVVWLRESGVVMVEEEKPVSLRGIFIDITAQKAAAEQLDQLNRKLVQASRLAGMSDVATSVLHNVGNVLNSVNVSANFIHDQLRNSRNYALGKACDLMDKHSSDFGKFFTSDPKGQRLPGFLRNLSQSQDEERATLMREATDLVKNVEHVKEIVAMQQNYAKTSGMIEDLPPETLIEESIRLNEGAFVRHGVVVKRHFEPVPPVRVDKHKVLQILINLLRNAKHAMDAAANRNEKMLTLAIAMNGNGRVKIIVQDNGIGISEENLTKIFNYGFTTKKEGHGFGLHSCANAATELGGTLHASSEGPGKGAKFVLELPIAPERKQTA
jgi:PAS domain S-box-containing protein